MRQKKRPEILAPAGSLEGMRAAVAAGCDAIYMGGSRFGARAYADNPLEEDMISAIRYCHRYGVKLYLTLNTLFKERELEGQLYNFLLPYVREGLDAVIVQDVGVLRRVHSLFPDLPIHASTQMTITMGQVGELLKPYGVTRIVPARELTLQELEQMGKDTDLEMEVFVHGALCYCYSGQCLFSSMLGGRSGNRGRCAQPCRQPYTLEETGERGYFLSPRENCNLNHVGDLIEIGVDSFKIEGRMKRPEYVALATALYRKYTDRCIELGMEGFRRYQRENEGEWQEDLRRLGELYNREGFTSGYLEGKSGVAFTPRKGRGQMLAKTRPRHGGILVGTVVSLEPRTVSYRLEKSLHPQDVVEFRNSRQEAVYEYTLGEEKLPGEVVCAHYQKGSQISPGDKVYRTKDATLLEEIRQTYLSSEPKLSVEMEWRAGEGEPLTLHLIEKSSRESITVTGQDCQKAQKRAATPEEIEKLLCKTGDTCFVVERCQGKLEGDLFIPVGAVKSLRREGLALLQNKLEERGKPQGGSVSEVDSSISPRGSYLLADRGISPNGCRPAADCKVSPGGSYPAADRGMSQLSSTNDAPPEVTNIVTALYPHQAELAIQSPGIREIYLRTEEMGEEELCHLLRQGVSAGKRMYLMMPLIFRGAVYSRECGRAESLQSIYHRKEWEGFVISNLESYHFLTKKVGVAPSRIITDANLYVTNRESLKFWQDWGVERHTLPLELTSREMKALLEPSQGEWGNTKKLVEQPTQQTIAYPVEPVDFSGMEAVVYGHLPLMVSAQCMCYNTKGCAKMSGSPGKILTATDEKKRRFNVYCGCKYCYNVIYQEEPLVLEEEKEVFRTMGVTRFRYDLTVEDRPETKKILNGDLMRGHKGHFYRGVE